MVSAMYDLASFERRRRKATRDIEIVLEFYERCFEHHPPSFWRKAVYHCKRQFLSHYFKWPPAWRLALRALGGERARPDFAVISAIKSGTSDLSVSLLMHPNVLMPISKEYDAWATRYCPTVEDRNRHAERFGVAMVPFVHPILRSLECMHYLGQLRPRCPVVLALRDPVARMYSHWKWEVLLSGKRRAEELPFLATFSAYVDHSLERFPAAPTHTKCGVVGLENSIYWKSVQSWKKWCGDDNVMVLDVGEYFRDRESVLRRIQEFVGLPYVRLPADVKPVNENPIELPRADEESLAKLRAFFRPYNERLWDVIGQRFEW